LQNLSGDRFRAGCEPDRGAAAATGGWCGTGTLGDAAGELPQHCTTFPPFRGNLRLTPCTLVTGCTARGFCEFSNV